MSLLTACPQSALPLGKLAARLRRVAFKRKDTQGKGKGTSALSAHSQQGAQSNSRAMSIYEPNWHSFE